MIGTPPLFEHLIRVLPLSGVREPSDAGLVMETDHGAIVALIDSAGQGRAAVGSAWTALEIVRRLATSSVPGAFLAVHQALAAGPGVSLAIARLDFAGSTIEFMGVGRVYSVVAGSVDRVFTSIPGTVGVGLPKAPEPVTVRFGSGDLLALAVDGLVDAWDLAKLRRRTDRLDLPALVQRISGIPGRLPDDGSVVLVRLP